MKKQFRDFESAREFARKLNLKSQNEWINYCKSGNKPDDIPQKVERTYKNYFKGYGDWLGHGNVANQDKQFRSFESARDLVITLNLKGHKGWLEYCKSGNKPDDIPSSPGKTYKNYFKGWGDFLGTGNIAPSYKQFRLFEEAKKFVQQLGLKSLKEWYAYCKSGNKPDDIPSRPDATYKNDFKGMGDFLGTGTIPSKDKVYRSFESAREFARALNLKGIKEWYAYCKSGKKPSDIPQKVERTYKNDFKGYGDWLGTGNVANKDKQFRSFTEAREFARKLNLKSQNEWKAYCKSGKKPSDIPSDPWRTYKEWKK
jgi:hypothetical protein